MATLPLDLRALLAAAPHGAESDVVPAGMRMGHVHLQVADLAPAEAFYHGLLGFDVTVRGYPGALFLSTGGYHHHLGLNTWASRGGSPNMPGSRGLDRFTLALPSAEALAPIAARLADAGVVTHAVADGGLLVTDPFGNDVLLAPPPSSAV
jgi:catechol 2,3-dioxygenase